jgi:uncharacterized membrane protein
MSVVKFVIGAEEPKLTRAQKAADVVTEFCGSWTFIISFSFITIGWMTMQRIAGQFDPYPFILLNLFLTVISTFQSPLIMMSQNRQMERDREAIRGLHEKLDDLAEQLRQLRETK